MPRLQPQKIKSNNRGADRMPATDSAEWVGLWSLSLGLAALLIASIVYFGGRDSVGASFVLVGTAVMVALVMRAGANPKD